MSCEFAHHDGAYVLGALSPVDRQQFERHLADCVECARATREFAGMPGLLARVDEEVLEPPPVEPVPEKLLPALINEVRQARRRRVFVAAGLAAAAAVTVAVGSLVLVNELGTPVAGAGPSAGISISAGAAMTPVRQQQMSARLAFETVQWGTKLDLTCSYVASAEYGRPEKAVTYALFVHTTDGRTEKVATWGSFPGKTMTLVATTAIPRKEIKSVEVRTTDGIQVLRMTA